ncbi:hypothetical protein KDA23_06920 [Candidatus Saccharibacteria bacterium]|nr:hypothetical protein [Candidatus Saccharibacteria bacterium]
MQPEKPETPGSDNVWISKQEYERLRALEKQQPVASSGSVFNEAQYKNERKAKDQRVWQVVLGGMLAIGLYWSVVSGSYANIFLAAAILVFGGISLWDYHNSRTYKVENGVAMKKTFRVNPYKLIALIILGITVLPVVAMIAFFMLFMSIGGGDVGS